MDPLTPAYTTASSLPAVKKTRHEIATQTALSLRYIDELTHNGTLPHFKIGKSIRYDPAEVEAALRERFHVRSKVRKPTSTGTRAPSSAA
jgi:excisionase family DNA binding protein